MGHGIEIASQEHAGSTFQRRSNGLGQRWIHDMLPGRQMVSRGDFGNVGAVDSPWRRMAMMPPKTPKPENRLAEGISVSHQANSISLLPNLVGDLQ